MRLGILMSVGSLWSREVALQLTRQGHEVHVIDFARGQGVSPQSLARQPKKADHSDEITNSPTRKCKGTEEGYLDSLSGHAEQEASKLAEQTAGLHYLDSTRGSDWRCAFRATSLRRLCARLQLDTLLLLYGGAFALAAYLSGFRPFALYTVGSDVLLAQGVRRRINRITYRAADLILSNGQYLCEKTTSLTGRSDVASLCLGVDSSRFLSPPRRPTDIRILCTRGFAPVYNNEYLIEALAELEPGTPYSAAVFASTGPGLPAARDLADRVLATEVRERVHFLGGVSDEQMLAELREASIYVSLSRSDGTSISLLEALSCGLFPILSDIPPNREWIDPSLENGILVPLDRPAELAAALRRAVTDSALRERAAIVNRSLIGERADARRNMITLASKLQSMVNERGSTR